MRLHKKHILLFLLLISQFVLGQSSFKVNAEQTSVEVGEAFSLVFEVIYQDEFPSFADNITFPEFKGFHEIGSSKFHSSSYINGEASVRVSVTKTLVAEDPGTFTIGRARVSHKKTLYTEPIQITVSGANTAPTQSPSTQNQSNQNSTPSPSDSHSSETRKTFAQLKIDKSTVYKSEAIVATLQLFSQDLSTFRNSISYETQSFAGFNSHKLDQVNPELFTKKLGSTEYYARDLFSIVLYPQNTGKLTLNSLKVILSSPFAFFGSNEASVEIFTDKVSVQVKDLPKGAPANFTGAVGDFNLNGFWDKTTVSAGESINFEVEVIGKGNLDVVSLGEYTADENFEVYPPVQRESFKASEEGLKGKIAAEFTMIPSYGGEFTLPEYSFSYFDTRKKSYQTLKTKPQKITVSGKPKPEVEEPFELESETKEVSAVPTRKESFIDIFIKEFKRLRTVQIEWEKSIKSFVGVLCVLLLSWILIRFFRKGYSVEDNKKQEEPTKKHESFNSIKSKPSSAIVTENSSLKDKLKALKKLSKEGDKQNFNSLKEEIIETAIKTPNIQGTTKRELTTELENLRYIRYSPFEQIDVNLADEFEVISGLIKEIK